MEIRDLIKLVVCVVHLQVKIHATEIDNLHLYLGCNQHFDVIKPGVDENQH